MKVRGITKVLRNCPLETMNVCTKCHGNPTIRFFFLQFGSGIASRQCLPHSVLVVLLLMWNLKGLKVFNYKMGSYLVVQSRNW